MDISKAILETIAQALECEEKRLKPRSVRGLWPWTVRGYYEDWIRYLLVRKLSDRFPEGEMQTEAEVGEVPQVDLLVCGLATVELKGPHKVEEGFDNAIKSAILQDFEKQKHRSRKEPNVEHFVLLILHARKVDFYSGVFQRWIDQLESDVRDKNPGICTKRKPSRPLVLNGGEPWLLECCLYRVF